MLDYKFRALDADTWPDFARLVEANNGVWGGCWCMWYHEKADGLTPLEKRGAKERRVREGRAHTALVFDGLNAWVGVNSVRQTSIRAG